MVACNDEYTGNAMSINRKLIEKTREILSKEKGTVYKDPGGRINVCLAFPNTYHIGMSNLGFQGIYTLLNERKDVVCERVFLPDEKDITEYSKTETELFSMESLKPLNRFDIIAFSVSFENDYPNILKILELGNVPLRSADRNERHPLVILGGVCASFNPEPLADFFDVCFIGEAEEMLSEFTEAYKKSSSKNDLLKNIIGIEGIYVPKFYSVEYEKGISKRTCFAGAFEKIKRRYIENISEKKIRPSIITPDTEFSNMYLIEAMRGCPWQCRFCVAGHIYSPARKKELATIKSEINSAMEITKRVGLIGPSLTDYPYVNEVLSTDGVDFSITSLRANPKSAELLRHLKNHKSISIAPEAGTERLRKVINKKITEEDIIETSRLILEQGIENMRLYFMVGLPTETDEDIKGIIELVKKIRSLSRTGKISLTISTFVPKPFTPFQWHPMEKIDIVKQKIKTIKKLLLPVWGVKVLHDVQKYAYMQGLLSMGDRRISYTLESMLKTNDWKKSCIESKIDTDFYIFRNKDIRETLPWNFIEQWTPKQKLWEEYQKALSEK
ncbi:MAG: radical SAM protein [Nitrospiraceae bacterium]|nr:radical SAM protein [Nitrospiraceae bacterium]